MGTSQKAKGTKKNVKDSLFIVWDEEHPCGPDSEVLVLSLRGKHDNPTFLYVDAVGFIKGRVVSMANMRLVQGLGKEIPPWGKGSNLEWWKLRLSDVLFCQGVEGLLNTEQVIGGIEMVYCSGPTAKDRWGIFAAGSMTAAIENLRGEICDAFDAFQPDARIWRDTSTTINIESHASAEWPHFIVRLDIRTWTLSFGRCESGKVGVEWQHTRIVCSTDPAKITEQAYKVFCELRDGKTLTISAQLAK